MTTKLLEEKALTFEKDTCKIKTTVTDTVELALILKSVKILSDWKSRAKRGRVFFSELINLPLKGEDVVFM